MASRLRIGRWSRRMKSATISRADRKAVSPEVIGAAITPSTASRPPSVPSQSRVIELTMIAALSLPDEAANSAVPSSVWKK